VSWRRGQKYLNLLLLGALPGFLQSTSWLKNWWNSGWIDVILATLLYLPLILALIDAGKRHTLLILLRSSMRTWSGLLAAFWLTCFVIGLPRGAESGPYTGIEGWLFAVRTIGMAAFVACSWQNLGPRRMLLALTLGLGAWVTANWLLVGMGAGNTAVNEGRLTFFDDEAHHHSRLLAYLGIQVPRIIFPLSDGYSAIGMPLGLTALLAAALSFTSGFGRWRIVTLVIFILALAGLLGADRRAPGFALLLSIPLLPSVPWLRWVRSGMPFVTVVGILALVLGYLLMKPDPHSEQALHNLLSGANRTLIWIWYCMDLFPQLAPNLFGEGYYGHFGVADAVFYRFGHLYDPHNQTLIVFLNNGMIGLTLWLTLHATILRHGLLAKAWWERTWMTVLVYMVMAGGFEERFGINQPTMTLAMFMVVACALSMKLRRPARSVDPA